MRRDGPNGAERVSFTWADGAIRNAWLQVTVEALSGDRVVGTDVFYYGNLPGETGDLAGPAATTRVNAVDLALTRAALLTRPAAIDNRFDHNRDGLVNVLDLAVARANRFAALTAPSQSVISAAASPSRIRSAYRPGSLLDESVAGDAIGPA